MNLLAKLATVILAGFGFTAAPQVQKGTASTDRAAFLAAAQSQMGVREATGNNDGPQVEAYLKSVGLKAGDPWCAAFIYWCGKQALGVRNPLPRSGWSPDFVRSPTWTRARGGQLQPGDVAGIYFASKKRVAHVFVIRSVGARSVGTFEGNTSPDAVEGSAADRDGGRAASKIRPLSTLHSARSWLP